MSKHIPDEDLSIPPFLNRNTAAASDDEAVPEIRVEAYDKIDHWRDKLDRAPKLKKRDVFERAATDLFLEAECERDLAAVRAIHDATYELGRDHAALSDDDIQFVMAGAEARAQGASERGHTNGSEQDNDGRHILTLEGGNLHNIATEAEAALIAAGAPLYSRSGDLVKPIVEDVPAFRGRRTKVARLKVVTPDILRDHVSRTVQFQRYDKRDKKMNIVDPPLAVVHTILARDGDWDFERLVGIITTPTLRPDGSILTTPGYDAATGLLLTSPPLMPAISEKPSRDDAEAALTLLNDLLVE